MIYSRSNAEHIKSQVMQNANGIGQSKTEAKNNSEVKGQNGQNVSVKAHSISSTENLRSATNQYVDFVKENFEGRVADNLNNETAIAFINSKADELSGGSLNTMISTMGKVADNMNELGISSIDRNAITDHRETLKDNGVNLQSDHVNRAYESPGEIVEKMGETPFQLSAELQHEAGLRADDALNSSKWSLNDDKTLNVEGSKGGVDYTTVPLSDSLFEKVQEAIENNYKGNYDEYREALKEVAGDEYDGKGTHGLRYNFAQENMERLQEEGKSYEDSLIDTSLAMGHSRAGIVLTYTKFDTED